MRTAHGGTLRRPGADRRTWHALGTYVQVVVDEAGAADAAERAVRQVLHHVDRACSRFREDSDLVRANAQAGRVVDVDPLLVEAAEAALDAAERTDGLVDPTLGLHLAAVGYDRDVSLIAGQDIGPVNLRRTPRRSGWREVETYADGRIRVPHGVALDLGATGKAFASDLAARLAAEAAGCGVLVSIGGDVAVGPSPSAPEDPAGWPVGVQETGRGDDQLREAVLIDRGGLATSSTLARSWSTGGQARHHLLDPRTGRPTAGPWRTVSATGATCVDANTASTAAIVLGRSAEPWLAERQIPARLVTVDGRVLRVGGWPAPLTVEVRP